MHHVHMQPPDLRAIRITSYAAMRQMLWFPAMHDRVRAAPVYDPHPEAPGSLEFRSARQADLDELIDAIRPHLNLSRAHVFARYEVQTHAYRKDIVWRGMLIVASVEQAVVLRLASEHLRRYSAR